jgi:hypothetical protein
MIWDDGFRLGLLYAQGERLAKDGAARQCRASANSDGDVHDDSDRKGREGLRRGQMHPKSKAREWLSVKKSPSEKMNGHFATCMDNHETRL